MPRDFHLDFWLLGFKDEVDSPDLIQAPGQAVWSMRLGSDPLPHPKLPKELGRAWMGLTFFLSPSPHVMDNKTNGKQIILATGLLLHWVRGVRFSALPRRLCQQALSPA